MSELILEALKRQELQAGGFSSADNSIWDKYIELLIQHTLPPYLTNEYVYA